MWKYVIVNNLAWFLAKIYRYIITFRDKCIKIIREIKDSVILFIKKLISRCTKFIKKNGEPSKQDKRRLYDRIYCLLSKFGMFHVFVSLFRVYALTNNRIEFYYIIGVEEFCEKNNNKIYELKSSGTTEVYIPEYFEKESDSVQSFEVPKVYCAEIDNAMVIGGSEVILVGQYALSDMAAMDKEKRVNICDYSIRKVIGDIAVVEHQKNTREIEGGAIALLSGVSYNYYHLLIETLSKLLYIDKNGLFEGYSILVDNVVKDIPQFSQALEIFNKNRHPIIWVNKGENVKVSKLVCVPNVVWMPINLYNRDGLRASDYLLAEGLLHFIRESIVEIKNDDINARRRIFISRKKTDNVRLMNEKEIRELFKRAGFEVVYTEEMTFKEQIECFSSAEWVACTSGAAMANTVFCRPGTNVVCFTSEKYKFYLYSTMAHLLGLNYSVLNVDIVKKSVYAALDKFTLDINYVKRFISERVDK